jgi:ketosteroid isomerase-like protein
MTDESEVTDLVRDLVAAENARDRASAEAILAEDFTAITRSSGVERNRDELLADIADPKRSIHRKLGDDVWVQASGDLAVVLSVVTTTDEAAPAEAPKSFRNCHVFQPRDGQWKCVAWQVTALEQRPNA